MDQDGVKVYISTNKISANMRSSWPRMKQPGVLPLNGILVHRKVIPIIKFTGTHLYTWVERGTARVLPKNTTQCPWKELKPRPLNPELSALWQHHTSFPRQVTYPITVDYVSGFPINFPLKLLKNGEINLFHRQPLATAQYWLWVYNYSTNQFENCNIHIDVHVALQIMYD